MENEEEDESPIAPAELIYSREEISVTMNIDPDLRSKNLVYGLAKDIHEEHLNELQSAVQGEITLEP